MSARSAARRRAAERAGRVSEWIAMGWLIAKGYRILGHRVRTAQGEVDLAALKGGVLAIVEVKRRGSVLKGLEAVAPRQQQRLMNAAAALARRWRLERAPIRFDLVIVGARFFPVHVRGAWWEDRVR